MSRPGLSKLYRRLTRRQPTTAALPRVETLLALAEGEHGADTERMLADVGRSGLHADLLRFARALAPESARLGVQLEQTFDVTTAAAHRQGQRSSRNVAARRGWLRAGGALTAGLFVAVAVWSFQRSHSLPQGSVAVAKQAVPDRIFAALNERPAASNKGDQIFRADFKSDHIFKFSDG